MNKGIARVNRWRKGYLYTSSSEQGKQEQVASIGRVLDGMSIVVDLLKEWEACVAWDANNWGAETKMREGKGRGRWQKKGARSLKETGEKDQQDRLGSGGRKGQGPSHLGDGPGWPCWQAFSKAHYPWSAQRSERKLK